MFRSKGPKDSDLTSIGISGPQLISCVRTVEKGTAPRTSGPDDLKTIAEKLDEAFSSPTVKPELKEWCSEILCKLSRSHNTRSKSCSPSGVTVSSEEPYKAVGSVRVWKGDQDGNQVCVKSFRIAEGPGLGEIKKGFYREIARWKYISHPNVLPFIGVLEKSPGLDGLAIVNPWLENGNILQYVSVNPDADRFQLLAQATLGLMHLHSLDILHGNIHPGNLLITKEGSVRLADFGIAAILTSSPPVRAASGAISKPNVVRYKAPELLGDDPTPLKESDVYSLAMAAFEVLSGVLPYDKKQGAKTAYSIINQERPPRPSNDIADRWLPDKVWHAIENCWGHGTQSRLHLRELHQTFVDLTSGKRGNATAPEDGAGSPKIIEEKSPTVKESPASLIQPAQPSGTQKGTGSAGNRMKSIWNWCSCRGGRG